MSPDITSNFLPNSCAISALSGCSACAAAWCTCFDCLPWTPSTLKLSILWRHKTGGSLWLMLMSGSQKCNFKATREVHHDLHPSRDAQGQEVMTQCDSCKHEEVNLESCRKVYSPPCRSPYHRTYHRAKSAGHNPLWPLDHSNLTQLAADAIKLIQNELDARGKEFGKFAFPRIRILVPYNSGPPKGERKRINTQHLDTPIDWWNLHPHLWDGSFFLIETCVQVHNTQMLCFCLLEWSWHNRDCRQKQKIWRSLNHAFLFQMLKQNQPLHFLSCIFISTFAEVCWAILALCHGRLGHPEAHGCHGRLAGSTPLIWFNTEETSMYISRLIVTLPVHSWLELNFIEPWCWTFYIPACPGTSTSILHTAACCYRLLGTDPR